MHLKSPSHAETLPAPREAWLPSIEGLRALAIVAVLVHHGNTIHFSNWALGNSGVAIFFSISGFLAYYVLWRDEHRFGRIDYNYFLFRRILRIWPAYFLVIAIGILFGIARTARCVKPTAPFHIHRELLPSVSSPLAASDVGDSLEYRCRGTVLPPRTADVFRPSLATLAGLFRRHCRAGKPHPDPLCDEFERRQLVLPQLRLPRHILGQAHWLQSGILKADASANKSRIPFLLARSSSSSRLCV